MAGYTTIYYEPFASRPAVFENTPTQYSTPRDAAYPYVEFAKQVDLVAAEGPAGEGVARIVATGYLGFQGYGAWDATCGRMRVDLRLDATIAAAMSTVSLVPIMNLKSSADAASGVANLWVDIRRVSIVGSTFNGEIRIVSAQMFVSSITAFTVEIGEWTTWAMSWQCGSNPTGGTAPLYLTPSADPDGWVIVTKTPFGGSTSTVKTLTGIGLLVHPYAPPYNQNNHAQLQSLGDFTNLYIEQCVGNQPLPIAMPPAPHVKCTPQTQVDNGGRGNAGCNTGGVGWTSSFTGTVGSVPVHPDPVEGELLTGKTAVDIWAELDVVAYPPTSPPYVTYRRSLTELADDPDYHGGRKPAGLVAVGDLEHGLGNDQNSFQAAAADVTWTDSIDRLFRTLLADQDLEGNEGRIYAASPAARADMSSPRPTGRLLMRGTVQRPALTPPLLTKLTLVDPLFADGGPFGPRRQLPHKIPGTVFTNAPAPSLEQGVPWVYGEKSDEGAVDPITNEPASKGVIPLTFVGRQTISDSPEPGVYEQDLTMPQPSWVSTTNILPNPGTPYFHGAIYLWFAALRVSDGKIGPWELDRSILNPNPEDVVPGSRTWPHIHFKFIDDEPDPAYNYIGFASSDPTYHPLTNPNVGVRGVAIHDGVTADSFYERDDGRDASLRIPAVDPLPNDEWDAYLVCLGASYQILSLFGSNLGGGVVDAQPDRVRIDIDARNGSDILFPWNADGSVASVWPFANTYVAYTGTDGTVWWFTMIFARGPMSDDHKNGVVNMTVNMIGREDVGDGTGDPIMRAEDARQQWFDNDVLTDYTSGLWVTNANAPMWNDGTYKVRSSTFNAHQAYTVDALGDIGLRVGWYCDTPKSVIEHVQEWDLSTETTTGVNGFGQITIGYLDETLDTTAFPHLDHVSDLFGPTSISSTFGENRENVVRGSCDWDPDSEKFRTGPVEFKSTVGYAKHQNHWTEPRELNTTILNDPDHFDWVLNKRLIRLHAGEIRVNATGPIGFLDHDVDDPGLLVSSREGRGANGYDRHPMLLKRRRFGVGSRLTTYALIDVQDVLLASLYVNGLDRQFPITDTENAQTPLISDDEDVAPLILL